LLNAVSVSAHIKLDSFFASVLFAVTRIESRNSKVQAAHANTEKKNNAKIDLQRCICLRSDILVLAMVQVDDDICP